MDESDDDEDDAADATPVIVETRELQNTENKRNSSTKAVLDLGTMVNNNKNMPKLDKFDDDASAVIVAAKIRAKENTMHRSTSHTDTLKLLSTKP
mmetsp:Transcript_8885/g.9467  ORF Transcript_8885/g.9467 Transcript_8885/m.9467 type:complete len:95 (-) Transcript_8885:28-312(-)